MEHTYAVLVNWNLKDDTLACVASLRSASLTPDRIVVVDNASTDGSVQALRQAFGPDLVQIENPENLGFPGAVNRGVQAALEAGAIWIFLLNNDTLVAPDLLARLHEAARDHPRYDILAPLILYHDHPDMIWYFGDRRLPGTLLTTSLYRDQPSGQPLPDLVEVDFVSGCGMLIHRRVFDKIGGFDDSLFMYGEEVDFCWRARLAGFHFASVSAARMWHKVSRSARRARPEMRYLRIRNQILFYRRYSKGLTLAVMFLFSLLRSMRIGLTDLISRHPELISPLWRGWWDGWFASLSTVPNP